MEEMLEDTFESMEDGEDMEEEAEEEVDKILFEITAGEKMCSAVHFHCVCLINMYPKSSGSELQLVDLCHKQISLTALLSLFPRFIRCPRQSTSQSHRRPA